MSSLAELLERTTALDGAIEKETAVLDQQLKVLLRLQTQRRALTEEITGALREARPELAHHQAVRSERDGIRNLAASAGSAGIRIEDAERLLPHRDRASIRADLNNLVRMQEFSREGDLYYWQCSPEERPEARKFSRKTIKSKES